MENQDIFNQFKKAADNAESPGFASMEKVWNRVEEKLDQKELKKQTGRWKKWAVAASVLLGISIGYQFLKDDKQIIDSKEIITEKSIVPKEQKSADAVVTAEKANPHIKEEADKILEKQILSQPRVAVAEQMNRTNNKWMSDSITGQETISASSPAFVKDLDSDRADKALERKESAKSLEVFANREAQLAKPKKEAPLLIYDNKLTSDKKLKQAIEDDEVESIIELKDPLYIINGIQYTEQELFGPNPTSPYTPLNKQDIETFSILEQEKAVEKYGEKGKKGVVIITTKNGKPKGSSNALKIKETEKK